MGSLCSSKRSRSGSADGDDPNKDLLSSKEVAEQKQKEAEEMRRQKKEEFRKDIELVFWVFVGYSKWKKNLTYMKKEELALFMGILNLRDYYYPLVRKRGLKQMTEQEMENEIVDKVYQLIDETDVVDGRITLAEFVSFFCDETINPDCHKLQSFVESQVSWKLLKRTLLVFKVVDKDRDGRLDYSDFTRFCGVIGISNPSQIEQLWHTIDTDDSGDLRVDEVFEWMQKQMVANREQMADVSAKHEERRKSYIAPQQYQLADGILGEVSETLSEDERADRLFDIPPATAPGPNDPDFDL